MYRYEVLSTEIWASLHNRLICLMHVKIGRRIWNQKLLFGLKSVIPVNNCFLAVKKHLVDMVFFVNLHVLLFFLLWLNTLRDQNKIKSSKFETFDLKTLLRTLSLFTKNQTLQEPKTFRMLFEMERFTLRRNTDQRPKESTMSLKTTGGQRWKSAKISTKCN